MLSKLFSPQVNLIFPKARLDFTSDVEKLEHIIFMSATNISNIFWTFRYYLNATASQSVLLFVEWKAEVGLKTTNQKQPCIKKTQQCVCRGE